MIPLITEVDSERGIVWISINRPEVLNAIDVGVARALHDAIVPLAGDPGVRCVVLRGCGRAFAAGGDVARFAEDNFRRAEAVVDEILGALNPAIEAMRNMDAPVLASVQGAAAGAGLSLVSACDIVVAAESARFVMAYDRVGAVPDCGGSYFLPRVIGVRKTAQLMMLGEPMTAVEARDSGLVNFVVSADRLAAETESLAIKLAAGPTRSYGQYKRLVGKSFSNSLHEQLEAERDAFKKSTWTQDFRAGVSAFLNKTKPEFKGN